MSEEPGLLRQSQERHYSAHNTFIHIALTELELAKPGMVGEFSHALVAITLSALAVEGLANAIGDRVIPEWSDFESAAPFAKLRLLADHLGLPYTSTTEPWSTLKWLCRLRNRLAHPKPEHVKQQKTVTQQEHESRSFVPPQSKLESEITEQNARRAVKAVEAIKYALAELVPMEQRFGLTSDGWTTSTGLSGVA
ncbi:MAG TPA: hypothetical protein VGI18_12395 [Burkholderiales bacterium]